MPEIGIPTNCSAPEWPETGARFGEPPAIDLALFIDVTGVVLKTKILKSTGARVFDDAARTALARCRFSPLLRQGAPVRGWVKVHYQWILE